MKKNFYITGIGGQGVVTLGKLIAESAKECGYDVSLLPIKGMAQRGGVITTYVRVGSRLAPIIPEGEADVIISMELSESLRSIPFIKNGGVLLCNLRTYIPQSVKLKDYPGVEDVEGYYNELNTQILWFDPKRVRQESGLQVLYENIGMLGLLSSVLSKEKYLKPDTVLGIIKSQLKSHIDENIKSFNAGYNYGTKYVHVFK